MGSRPTHFKSSSGSQCKASGAAKQRVQDGRDPKLPIQSPTLEIIFRNKDKITTSVEATEKGVAVVQTSADTETVRALQKHAAEVSDLAKRGMTAPHEGVMQR